MYVRCIVFSIKELGKRKKTSVKILVFFKIKVMYVWRFSLYVYQVWAIQRSEDTGSSGSVLVEAFHLFLAAW